MRLQQTGFYSSLYYTGVYIDVRVTIIPLHVTLQYVTCLHHNPAQLDLTYLTAYLSLSLSLSSSKDHSWKSLDLHRLSNVVRSCVFAVVRASRTGAYGGDKTHIPLLHDPTYM